jgi:hypothetical protein
MAGHLAPQSLQALLIELRLLPASVWQRGDASSLALLSEELLRSSE